MAAGRKLVTFDLDTKALEDYYPTASWQNAYEVIKRHMLKNGFSWPQGSVYISKASMTGTDVDVVIEKLIKKNQWLNVCVRDCKQANIGKYYDQSHLFDIAVDVPRRDGR